MRHGHDSRPVYWQLQPANRLLSTVRSAATSTGMQGVRTRRQQVVSASADGGDTESLMNDAAAAQQRRAKSAKRRQRQQEQQQAQQEGQEVSADTPAGTQLQGGRPLSLSQQQEALFEGKYGLPVSCTAQRNTFVRHSNNPWQCKRYFHPSSGINGFQSAALTSGECPDF